MTSGDATDARLISPGLVRILSDGTPRLQGGRCKACGALSFPRALVCTNCLSLDVEAELLSSEGRLYSYSIVHQAPKAWKVPYALGYVDLPEGVRVLAHLEIDLDALAIDQPVRLSLAVVATDPDERDLSTYTFVPA